MSGDAKPDAMSTPRQWSNNELNAWLQQCLAVERAEIRKLTVAGLSSALKKRDDPIAEILGSHSASIETVAASITAKAEVADRNAAKVDELIVQLNDAFACIERLQSEVETLKANQANTSKAGTTKLGGWFSR